MPEVITAFRGGLKHYREGAFDRALAQFREALALNPDDTVSQVFVERCEFLKQNPQREWEGIWVMKTK
jgi:adenylate cyclase